MVLAVRSVGRVDVVRHLLCVVIHFHPLPSAPLPHEALSRIGVVPVLEVLRNIHFLSLSAWIERL